MERREDFVPAFIRWVTDGFVVLFGLWTVLCNFTVLTHKSFSFLVRFSPLVPLSAAAVLFLLARLRDRDRSSSRVEVRAEEEVPGTRHRAVGLAGAGLLVLVYFVGGNYLLFWSLSCLFLVVFVVMNLPGQAFRPERPEKQPFETAVFLALVLAALALVLFLHRPDLDDSLYMSVPVKALENPGAPLLSDQFIRKNSPEAISPTYFVHSVEMAAGLLAKLLRVRPIAAAHLLLSSLFAVFFMCAVARLLRLLLGRAWLVGLAVLLFVLLVDGDSHWSYGNFSLVRLFQGKSLLVSGVAPLLAAYSLEYMSRGERRVWPLLFFGQVAGLGLSSAGLYVGPLAAGLSLLGGWRPGRRTAGRLLLGGLAAVYPLAMGAYIKYVPMTANPVFFEATRRVPAVPELLAKVFGSGVFAGVWLLTLLGGWAIFRDRARRRWILVYALVFLLLFLNPFLAAFWARQLLGVETMWRVLWVLPLPVWLAALLSSAGTGIAGLLGRPRARAAVFVLVVILFGLLIPARWTVSRSNRTVLRWPSLKVPPEEFGLAVRAAELTGPGRFILAPEEVAAWIPTINRKVGILAGREFFLVLVRDRISSPEGRREVSRRLDVLRYLSGKSGPVTRPERRALLKRTVEDYRVQTVVLPRSNTWRHEIETVLREVGFRKLAVPVRGYLLYRRE